MSKSNIQEQTVADTKVTPPSQFKVLFHNDERTTMGFVVSLLVDVFHKSREEALVITILVHETGQGIAGIYSREIAEEKTEQSLKIARQQSYPLNVTFEEM